MEQFSFPLIVGHLDLGEVGIVVIGDMFVDFKKNMKNLV